MLPIRLIFAVSTLFSAGGDKTVKQWDLDYRSCFRTFEGHNSSVNSLASTVGADRLLSGDKSGSVLLWDIATGQLLAKVNAHSGCVSCLAVTPDGSSFVSGSWDHSLKLWRFEELQPVIQFSGHSREVNACVVSSDGRRLYSGSYDDSIRVWDMATGQLLKSMNSYCIRVTSLALSGSMLVSCSLFWNHLVSMQNNASTKCAKKKSNLVKTEVKYLITKRFKTASCMRFMGWLRE